MKTESSDNSSPAEIRIKNRIYTIKPKYGGGQTPAIFPANINTDAQQAFNLANNEFMMTALHQRSAERARLIQSALHVSAEKEIKAPRKLDQVDLLVAKANKQRRSLPQQEIKVQV